jgi:hypothetical protein
MAHGDAREGKWRRKWRMEWVASTLHTTAEHGVSSFTTAYMHIPAASSRLNWRPCRFKWTRPFRRKTKSGFCACAITFQTHHVSCTEETHKDNFFLDTWECHLIFMTTFWVRFVVVLKIQQPYPRQKKKTEEEYSQPLAKASGNKLVFS